MTVRREDRAVPVVLTPVEAAAEAWHQRNAAREELMVRRLSPDRCWCCCPACKRFNPHFRPAWLIKLADIRQQLSVLYVESRTERADDQREGSHRRTKKVTDGGAG